MLVIGNSFCVAALRNAPEIVGDGVSTVRELIHGKNTALAKLGKSDSRVPIDQETERCIAAFGYGIDNLVSEGVRLRIRNNCNVHTGGSIQDITNKINSRVKKVAYEISTILKTPVLGIDLIMPDIGGSDYVFIEANERPALVNHEPHDTAGNFIRFLFPGISKSN